MESKKTTNLLLLIITVCLILITGKLYNVPLTSDANAQNSTMNVKVENFEELEWKIRYQLMAIFNLSLTKKSLDVNVLNIDDLK